MIVQKTLRYATIALAAAALWTATPSAFAQGRGAFADLPEDQAALGQEFNTAVRDASMATAEKLTAAQAALADAIFAAKLDEAAIKEKAAAVAALQLELYTIRAKEFDKGRAKYSNAALVTALKASAFQAGRGGRGGQGGRGRGQQ